MVAGDPPVQPVSSLFPGALFQRCSDSYGAGGDFSRMLFYAVIFTVFAVATESCWHGWTRD